MSRSPVALLREEGGRFFRISIVFACSELNFRNRFSSWSRSSAPGWCRATPGANPAPSAALAFSARPRKGSGLVPGSWAASVAVRPGGRAGSIVSRWYSSGYRFVYVLPAWHCFLWNLGSRSPGLPVSRIRGGGASPRAARGRGRRGRGGAGCLNAVGRRTDGAVTAREPELAEFRPRQVAGWGVRVHRRRFCGLLPDVCGLVKPRHVGA